MNLKKIATLLWIISFSLGWNLPAQSANEITPHSIYFDLEMPFRCKVDNVFERNLLTFVPLEKRDFSISLPSYTNDLPRFQVNSFSFRKQPLDRALVNLFHETDIQIESELEVCPVLSATSLNGELSSVINELMKKAGVFYTYDSDKKVFVLKDKTPVNIQLPKNKEVMMAIVDALSGGKFNPISSDWLNYQITLNLTRGELTEVRSLINSFLRDKYLLSAQISAYEINPISNVTHWQQTLADFGANRVASSNAGTGGNLMVFNPTVDASQLVSKAMKYDEVIPLAQGQTIIPSGWQVRFNFGECMMAPAYTKLSVVLSSEVKKNKAKTVLTLDSQEGEVSSFEFLNALDQEAAIIGIPNPGKKNSELLFIVKFKFINLAKQGE